MKAFRITANDRRDESALSKCLVVAENFDEARRAAIEYLEAEWPGVPIELTGVETLNDAVVMAHGVKESIMEARA